MKTLILLAAIAAVTLSAVSAVPAAAQGYSVNSSNGTYRNAPPPPPPPQAAPRQNSVNAVRG
jgi:hypothetical protein